MMGGLFNCLFARGHVEFEIRCQGYVSEDVLQLKTYRNGEYAFCLHLAYSDSMWPASALLDRKGEHQISEAVYNELKPIFMKAKGELMHSFNVCQPWLDFSKEIEQVLVDARVLPLIPLKDIEPED